MFKQAFYAIHSLGTWPVAKALLKRLTSIKLHKHAVVAI